MRKKKSSLLLLFLVLFLVIGARGNAYAAVNSPSISVDQVTGSAGETVDLHVSISDNPGILGAVFTVTYDEKLALTAASNGDAFSPLVMTKPGVFQSPCRFVWDAQEITDDQIKDGTILTLTFAIPETAKAGDVYTVSVTPSSDDIVDRDLDTVTVLPAEGSITVSGGSEPEGESIDVKATKEEESVVARLENKGAKRAVFVLLATYEDSGRFIGLKVQNTDLPTGVSTVSFDDAATEENQKVLVVDDDYRPVGPAADVSETAVSDAFGLGAATVNAAPGSQNIEVDISVANNPGIMGMVLSVAYDNDLTLVGAENGEAVSKVLALTKPGAFVSGCRFVWDGLSLSDSDIQDGTVLTLVFNVSEKAAKGNHVITLSYDSGDIVDGDMNDLNPELTSGAVIVK